MARRPGLALALALVALAGCTAGGPDGGEASASSPGGVPAVTASGSAPAASPGTTVLGALEPVEIRVLDGVDAGAATGRTLAVPSGWAVAAWASVPNARLAAWDPDGRLLVSSGDAGAVWLLTPGDEDEAPEATPLLEGLSNPQGLAFSEDGATLVVGEEDRIVAYAYADGAADEPRVLVDELPTSGHSAKAVAIAGDTVYFSVGSESNASPSDREGDPERAIVAAVSLEGGESRTVARGVRNGFALAMAPDGTLFGAVNQADNQPYPFDDDSGRYGSADAAYVNENPVDQVARLAQGADLGWPYCVPDTRGSEDLLALPFIAHPDNNPDGEALDCDALEPTMLGLPAHSAPLGLAFTSGTPLADVLGDAALITSHGSWNREPPRAPSVVLSAWDGGSATLGETRPLVSGFQDEDGSRWGRAVTAVPGPDGAIYVTDDQAGLVYRVVPPR